MFRFFILMLAVLSASSVGYARTDIDRITNIEAVKSYTIRSLYPKVAELHALGEKEYRSPDRATGLYKILPENGEAEWKAIRALVDLANRYGAINDPDLSELATAYIRKRPNFEHISVAFASDFRDIDELSEPYKAAVYAFRNEIRELLAARKQLAFYTIFSSNEAQGHIGFVLFNRNTNEALYVSTISDH